MIGWIILALAIALLLIALIRALAAKPVAQKREPAKEYALDEDAIAKRVAGALRFKTVSTLDPKDTDWGEFTALHTYIQATYPLVHKAMTHELINDYSLLYRWKGTDDTVLPILLMAHQDVVPVAPETIHEWKHGAFSGDIADGYVWGRGAIDMKGQLMSILEAAEHLLASGFVPKRDIYFAFGHNEEVVNETGAQMTAKTLKERGLRFEFVLDEGGAITSGKSFSVDKTLALIGIFEKGYADIKFEAKSKGGHASMPPKHTALGEVAQAVVDIEKAPMKAKIAGPTALLFDALVPHMSFVFKLLFANRWLFGGLLKGVIGSSPAGNALIRTTTAATMAQGSLAPNVLPQVASVVANFRIAAWDTPDKLLAHLRKAVKNKNVEITALKASSPSMVSSTVNGAYALISGTVAQLFPDMVIAPYPMVGATDSRHYSIVSDNIYRFVPFRSLLEDLDTMHANNERVSVRSLREAVAFFMQLMENAQQV